MQHILYEKHTYIIPNLVKEKYKNDNFVDEDFKDNLKFLWNYFKYMLIGNYSLDPATSKIKFKSKFPSIDLTWAYVNSYIRNKFKEACKINNEKIRNTKKIFKLYDSNGNIISKVISFENNKDKITYNKYVLIANGNMLDNLSDNMIGQYFMDYT